MSDSLLIDTTLGGRYRLLRPIGDGGMARVFEALDEVLDRRVAVKVLHERFADDAQFAERFWREARAVASLNHAHIVQVYDSSHSEGGPAYIVMELVHGPSLQSLVDAPGRVPAERAVELVAQAAHGLAHAHERGIVHRDVKPQNLLFDEHGALKVADFGIARSADAGDTLTEAGSIVGTARYLAPEQAQGHRVTPATDVYSLGVVLYELVAGRPPFTGDSPIQVALQQVNERPVPPSTYAPDLDPRLESIILSTLAKDPAARPADAAALLAELRTPRAAGAAEAATELLPAATVALPVTEPRSRRRGRLGIALLVLGALALAALVPAFVRSGGDDQQADAQKTTASTTPTTRTAATTDVAPVAATPEPTTTPAPTLTGLRLDAAQEAVAAAGLQIVIASSVARDDVEAGTVVSQDPPEGAPLAAGATIGVVVSSGPAADTRPEQSGKPDKAGKAEKRAKRGKR